MAQIPNETPEQRRLRLERERDRLRRQVFDSGGRESLLAPQWMKDRYKVVNDELYRISTNRAVQARQRGDISFGQRGAAVNDAVRQLTSPPSFVSNEPQPSARQQNQARADRQDLMRRYEARATREFQAALSDWRLQPNTLPYAMRQVEQAFGSSLTGDAREFIESVLNTRLRAPSGELFSPVAGDFERRFQGRLADNDVADIISKLTSQEGQASLGAELTAFRRERAMQQRRTRGLDIEPSQMLFTPDEAEAFVNRGELPERLRLQQQAMREQVESSQLVDPNTFGVGAAFDAASKAVARGPLGVAEMALFSLADRVTGQDASYQNVASYRQAWRDAAKAARPLLAQTYDQMERMAALPFVELGNLISLMPSNETRGAGRAISQFGRGVIRGGTQFLSDVADVPRLLVGSDVFGTLSMMARDAINDQAPLDKTPLNTLAQGIGSMAGAVVLSLATGGAAAPSMGSALARTVASITMGVFEAGANAASAQRAALDRGVSYSDSRNRALQAIATDFAISSVLNRLGIFGEAFNVSRRQLVNVAAKAMYAAGLEGVQEGMQETLAQFVETNQIDPTTDRVIEAAILGAILGGGASVVTGEATKAWEPTPDDVLAKEFGLSQLDIATAKTSMGYSTALERLVKQGSSPWRWNDAPGRLGAEQDSEVQQPVREPGVAPADAIKQELPDVDSLPRINFQDGEPLIKPDALAESEREPGVAESVDSLHVEAQPDDVQLDAGAATQDANVELGAQTTAATPSAEDLIASAIQDANPTTDSAVVEEQPRRGRRFPNQANDAPPDGATSPDSGIPSAEELIAAYTEEQSGSDALNDPGGQVSEPLPNEVVDPAAEGFVADDAPPEPLPNEVVDPAAEGFVADDAPPEPLPNEVVDPAAEGFVADDAPSEPTRAANGAIGKNKDGADVFEDERGQRFIARNGVRIGQKMRMEMTAGGISGVPVYDPEYLTETEIADKVDAAWSEIKNFIDDHPLKTAADQAAIRRLLLADDTGNAVPNLIEALRKAKATLPAFIDAMNDIAAVTNATLDMGPIKRPASIVNKLLSDFKYRQDARNLTDLLRATLVDTSLSDVMRIKDSLIELYGEPVVLKDRFASPVYGYRDILSVFNIAGVNSEIQIHLQAILDAKKASGHDLYKRGEQAVADNDQALFKSLMQEMQKLYDDALSGSGDMYSSQYSSNRSGGSGIMTRAESSASDTVSPIGVSDPSASSQSKSRVPGSTTSGLSLRSQSAIEESGRGAVTSQSSTTNYGTNPQDQEVRADVADTRTRDERKFDAKVERNTPARWEEGVSESNKKRLSDDGHFWTDSNIMLVVPNDRDLLPNMHWTGAPMSRAKMDRIWDAVDASPDNSAPLEFMGQLPGDADAYDVYGETIAIDRHKLGLVEELFGPVKYFGTTPDKPVAAYNRNGLKVAVIMPMNADDGDISILRQRWNNRPSPAASSDNQQQTQVKTQAKQEETPPREPDAAVSTAVANARNTYNQEYNYSGSTENALAKVEEIIASVDPALQQAVRDEIGDIVTWGENLRLQFGHPADARRSGDLKTPEREMLRERLANKLVQDQITLLGDKARYEDEIILIVGGPGAGKTSTQNAVVETEGAIVLDPDVIKPLLPEYDALGPQFVHDESTHVLRLALVIAADMDINTIVTGTGRDGTYLKEKIVAPFKERGYSVHGVLVEISPETAIGRVAQRVSEGGHGVHPDVIRDATLKAAETFGIMVNEGFYDGYIGLWNETPLGAPPDIRLLGPGVGERLRDRFERQSAAGSERDANSQRGSNSESVSGRTGRVSRGAAGRGAQGDRRGPAPAPGAVPSGNESEVSENAEVTTGADDLPAHVAGLLSPEQLAWVKRLVVQNDERLGELNQNRNKRIKDMRDKRRGAVDITLEDFEWVARSAIKSVLQGIETLNEAFGRLVFEERFRDDEIAKARVVLDDLVGEMAIGDVITAIEQGITARGESNEINTGSTAGSGQERTQTALPQDGEGAGAERDAISSDVVGARNQGDDGQARGENDLGGSTVNRPARSDRDRGSADRDGAGSTGRASVYGGGEIADYRPRELSDVRPPATQSGKLTAVVNALRAINELRQGELRSEARLSAIAQFPGWGFDKNVLVPSKASGATPKAKELRSLMTREQMIDATKATINSHFTDARVVSAMWDALSHLGFKGGSVLEPSSGSGLFAMAQPNELYENSTWTMIEMDSTTAEVADMLHPQQTVIKAPFQRSRVRSNSYDLVISNVPFSATLQDPIYDPVLYERLGQKLSDQLFGRVHNYFFVKALDVVKPGGVVAFITTKGTMDASDPAGVAVRQYLSEQADLLGAVRLPQQAFGEQANTEVVTDIIVLRKRRDGESPSGHAWVDLETVGLESESGNILPYRLNQYFKTNPSHVLGEQSMTGTMYTGESYTVNGEGADALAESIRRTLIKALPQGAFNPTTVSRPVEESIPVPEGLNVGEVYFHDGSAYSVSAARTAKPLELSDKDAATMLAYLKVKDALKSVLAAQASSDADLAKAQKHLEKTYDQFVKKHGRINENTVVVSNVVNSETKKRETRESLRYRHRPLLSKDAAWARVFALEKINAETGKFLSLADVFTKRVISTTQDVTIDNPMDALNASLNLRGAVDMQWMAEQLGMNEKTLVAQLKDAVFELPDGGYMAAEEYLSGPVGVRLRAAESAVAAGRNEFARHVEELKKVQPAPKPYNRIAWAPAAPWIDEAMLKLAIATVLDDKRVTELLTKTLRGWRVDRMDRLSMYAARQKYTRSGQPIHDILKAVLNNAPKKFYTKLPDDRRVLDEETTLAFKDDMDAMAADIVAAVDANGQWQDSVANSYNTIINANTPEIFKGTHLTFPGLNRDAVELRKQRVDAVSRGMRKPFSLFWHGVGSGKTYTGVMLANKLKQTGLRNKVVFVAYKPTLEQIGREFYQAYPNGNFLIATEDSLSKNNRDVFLASAATGDWDAIVMTHEQFASIGLSESALKAHFDAEVDALMDAAGIDRGQDLDTLLKNRRNEPKTADAARLILALTEKMEKKLDELRKNPNTITLDALGVDHVIVDEAHFFKGMPLVSDRPGIGIGQSSRAFDMQLKLSYLRSIGGGATMMTGTALVNSGAEIYVWTRYLAPESLTYAGLHSFDAWLDQFASFEESVEATVDGALAEKLRIRKWMNVEELGHMFSLFSDIVPTETVDGIKLPDLEDAEGNVTGKPIVHQVEPGEAQVDLIRQIASQFRNLAVISDPIQRAAERFRLMDRSKKAAQDPRFVEPNIQLSDTDDAALKVEVMATEAARIYAGDSKAGQVLFVDMGIPDGAGFDLYNDVKRRLIAKGIAPKHIAMISDAKNASQRVKMAEAFREGKTRILIGSRAKLGVGMNIQKRLKAVHHVMLGWNPAMLEQGNGRIVRHGNEYEQVQVHYYITKATYDQVMAERTQNKRSVFTDFMNALSGVEQGVSELAEIETEEGAGAMEDVVAAASGDTRLVELVQLDARARKLQLKVSAINRDIATKRGQLSSAQATKTKLQGEMATLQTALNWFTENGVTDKTVLEIDEAFRHVNEDGKLSTSRQTLIYAFDETRDLHNPALEIPTYTAFGTLGDGMVVQLGYSGIQFVQTHKQNRRESSPQAVLQAQPLMVRVGKITRQLHSAAEAADWYMKPVAELQKALRSYESFLEANAEMQQAIAAELERADNPAQQELDEVEKQLLNLQFDTGITADDIKSGSIDLINYVAHRGVMLDGDPVEVTVDHNFAGERRTETYRVGGINTNGTMLFLHRRSENDLNDRLIQQLDQSIVRIHSGNRVYRPKEEHRILIARAIAEQELFSPAGRIAATFLPPEEVAELEAKQARAQSSEPVTAEETLDLTDLADDTNTDEQTGGDTGTDAPGGDVLRSPSRAGTSSSIAGWNPPQKRRGAPKRLSEMTLDLSKKFPRVVSNAAVKGAAGVYLPKPDMRMVRFSTDLRAHSHELAHQLHYNLSLFANWNDDTFPAQVLEELTHPDLQSTLANLKPGQLENLSPEQVISEQWAEFMVALIHTPELVASKFPALTRYYVDNVPGAIRKDINEFIRDVQTYRFASRSQQIGAGINAPQVRTGFYNAFREFIDSLRGDRGDSLQHVWSPTWTTKYWRVLMTDRFAPLQEATEELVKRQGLSMTGPLISDRSLEDNPIVWLRLLPYTDQIVNAMITGGLRTLDNQPVRYGDEQPLSIVNMLNTLDADRWDEHYQDAISYGYAERHLSFSQREHERMQKELDKRYQDETAKAQARTEHHSMLVDMWSEQLITSITNSVAKAMTPEAKAVEIKRVRNLATRRKTRYYRAQMTRLDRVMLDATAALKDAFEFKVSRAGLVVPQDSSKSADEYAADTIAEIEAKGVNYVNSIKSFLEQYRAIGDWSLQMQVDSEMLSPVDAEQIRASNPYWISAQRDMESGETLESVVKGTLKSATDTIETFEGSERAKLDPTYSLMTIIFETVQNSYINRVTNKFTTLAELAPNSGDIAVRLPDKDHRLNPKHVIKTKRLVEARNYDGSPQLDEDGEPILKVAEEEWHIKDPVLARAITEANEGFGMADIIRPLEATANWLRAGVTNLPQFAVRNVVRDTVSRLMVSKYLRYLGGNSAASRLANKLTVYGTFQKPLEEYVYDSLAIGFGISETLGNKTSWDAKTLELMSRAKREGNLVLKTSRTASRLFHKLYMGGFLRWSEAANRSAEFRGAKLYAERELGLDENIAEMYAAYEARVTMTDFRRRGRLIGAFSPYVPFLNAAFQGQASFWTRVQANPKAFVLRLALYAMLAGGLEELYALFTGSTRERLALPDYQRDRFWNFKIVGTDRWIMIPKGHEVSVFMMAADRAYNAVRRGEQLNPFRVATAAWQQISPADATDLLSVARVPLEIATNTDLFNWRPIIPSYEKDLELKYRSLDNATSVARALASGANLGTSAVGLGERVDPRLIDHAIAQLFGYAGQSVINVSRSADGRRDWIDTAVSFTGIVGRTNPVANAQVLEVDRIAAGVGTVSPLKAYRKAYFDARSVEDKNEAALLYISRAQEILPDMRRIQASRLSQADKRQAIGGFR